MGKSASAPTPDPALIAAQIKSMGIQDASIQQILKNSNEMLPLQKQQLEFGLNAAKTGFQQSQDDREWALGRRQALTSLQDRMISEAAGFSAEQRGSQLAGQNAADVQQAAATAEADADLSLRRSGVSPSSGRALAIRQAMSLGKTATLADAMSKGRAQAKLEGIQLTDRASNALAGYPAMGMSASGAGVNTGTVGVNLTNAGVVGQNSGFSAAGTIAGQMGGNAAGMYGTMGNYQANMSQAEGQATGSIVGAGITAAAML